MLKEYEINNATLAIISLDNGTSRVFENDTEYLVSKNALEIIDDSCKYFGSSYNGRYDGTKNIIGSNYKLPILVEETKNIVFFPTISPRLENCSWISLNNILNYEKNNSYSSIIFKNGTKISLSISIFSLENQILRASRLQSIIQNRKCY